MKSDVIVCGATGSFILPLLAILIFHYGDSQPLWIVTKYGSKVFNPYALNLLYLALIMGALIGSVLSIFVPMTKRYVNSLMLNCLIGWFAGSLAGFVFFYHVVALLNYFPALWVCVFGFFVSVVFLWAGIIKRKI